MNTLARRLGLCLAVILPGGCLYLPETTTRYDPECGIYERKAIMQPHQHIHGIADHMCIRHDNARRFDDETGPSALDHRPSAARRFALRAFPLLPAPFRSRAFARGDLNTDDRRDNALREISKIRQAALRNGRAASAKGDRQAKRGAAR